MALTPGKVRCSPCSRRRGRCAWLRVAPLLPSPPLRPMATDASGRDGKAGASAEPESPAGVIGISASAPRKGTFWRSRNRGHSGVALTASGPRLSGQSPEEDRGRGSAQSRAGGRIPEASQGGGAKGCDPRTIALLQAWPRIQNPETLCPINQKSDDLVSQGGVSQGGLSRQMGHFSRSIRRQRSFPWHGASMSLKERRVLP